MYWLLKFLPKNHLSATVGALSRIPLPRWTRMPVVWSFAQLVGANTEETSKPLAEYRSIAEFFTRDLAEGARPIQKGIISPVDGNFRSLVDIDCNELPQVKGRTYSVSELLGGASEAAKFKGGALASLYLAPPDYHHVHAPIDGEVEEIRYFPGSLWPVNSWALSTISDLFSRNERVVIYLRTKFGRCAVVMVGATNVGKMTLTFDSLVTNVGAQQPLVRSFNPSIALRKGERLGTFHLGSTVLLLLDAHVSAGFSIVRDPGKIRLGESLFLERLTQD